MHFILSFGTLSRKHLAIFRNHPADETGVNERTQVCILVRRHNRATPLLCRNFVLMRGAQYKQKLVSAP